MMGTTRRGWKVTLAWNVSRECSGPNVWDMLYFQKRWQSSSCCHGKMFTKHEIPISQAILLSVPSFAWSPLLFLSPSVFQALHFAFIPCEMPCMPSADHCLPTFLHSTASTFLKVMLRPAFKSYMVACTTNPSIV